MSANFRQDRLNIPFEFIEVLVSSREKAKLQRGLVENQLFEVGSDTYTVQDFRTRELSVRLRTINNACDAMAFLPDGTPLTEVSMYGSRERQYLTGPYKSVIRLIAGEIPSSSASLQEISIAHATLSQSIRQLESWISLLISSGRVTNITLQGYLTQLLRSDEEYIRNSIEELEKIMTELQKLDQEVRDWNVWWAPWGEPATSVTQRTSEILMKKNEVMDRLAQLVVPPNEYSKKFN